MVNITMVLEKNMLVLRINVKDTGTPSASGKSVVVASTRGNVPVPGTDLTLGLNLYRKKQ